MFCPYCGKEPPADAIFCNHCGKSLGKENFSGDLEASRLTESRFLDEQQSVFFQVQSPLQNRLQKLMIRIFDAALAGNALFGVLLGSIIAIVGGVLVSWLLVTIAHLISAPLTQTVYRGENIGYILGIVPLHASLKDSLQLFLVIHGVASHISETGGAYLYAMPLNGLLLLPAMLLTLGGYISACTDLRNHVRSSLLRGGAIAIPYTFLLFIIVTQVNGNVPSSSDASSITALSMDTTTLVIFGLLWSVLFGLLGASLKLAGGQWRHMMRRYVQAGSHVQLKGMITGGLSAGGLGFSLSFLWLCCLLPYTPINFFFQGDFCNGGPWQTRLVWNIAQGPLYAVNLFFFSLGAPITTHLLEPYTPVSCFYATQAQPVLALTDSRLHLPVWMYISLLLIPAVSLFIGGRVSAALSRARLRGLGPRMVQGAACAFPFTVLMMLCTFLSTITEVSISPAPTGVVGTTNQASAGVGAIDLLLWTMLWAVVLGALGGAYQDSVLQSKAQKILLGLIRPIIGLPRPLFILLDRLSGIRRPATRSRARSLLYGTFFVCLLLIIVTAVTGIALISLNQTLSFNTNQTIRSVLSCMLIALPGLLLLCSCASAISRDPLA